MWGVVTGGEGEGEGLDLGAGEGGGRGEDELLRFHLLRAWLGRTI